MQSVYSAAPANWALSWRVLFLCWDAVGIFCCPNRLGPHLESPTPMQRCSRCIQQPLATGPTVCESYSSAEMQSVYSAAPTGWALSLGVLFFCRDAVSIFCSPKQLGPQFGSLIPLQTCSQCILQLQPTGPYLFNAIKYQIILERITPLKENIYKNVGLISTSFLLIIF